MSEIIKQGPFKGLRRNHYKTIYADPPWTFKTRSNKGKGRSPEQHYECMTLPEIKALPVAELAAKDCVLLMWTIDTHIPMALDVIKAWGFAFKTVGFYWAKENKDGSDFTGMGYWTRANPEQCLMALSGGASQCLLSTIGAPKRVSKKVKRLVRAPRREHSRKPDEMIDSIEELVPGPYLELFARQSRPGWSSWGDQTTLFDDPIRRRYTDDIEALLGGGVSAPEDSTIYCSDIMELL